MFSFDKPYNQDSFINFLKDEFLPEDFKERLEELDFDLGQKIDRVHKIGKVSSLDGLTIYEIHHESEHDPRVTLTRESFKLIKHYGVKNALAAFVSENSDNYRFSLITSSLNLTEEGQAKREFSNPRRYSYLLGPEAKVKTPEMYLRQKDRVTGLEDLQDRFDIKVLTKKFYNELSNWYFWALNNVKFPEGAEEQSGGRNMAVIRMITRLVFIWFMKERDLVPDKLFNHEKVKNTLTTVEEERSTYYKAVLQNLFFATLNTEIEDRGFRESHSYHGRNKDFMNHSIYRYEKFFQNPDEILDLFKGIPFLNGGIFECLDDRKKIDGANKYTRIDGFSDRKDNELTVPNFLFFSDDRKVDISDHFESGHKEETVRGLINVLNDYNFTIDENTPIDKEVSLDPELLGHIFENLLASYNPETATTARKSTGSYYTPRPVVEFMTDISLKEYFLNELNRPEKNTEDLKAKLDDLLSYHVEGHDLDQNQADKLIEAIDELKIIDPAVGSGAFPMGILQKLVLVLEKLDPEAQKWLDMKLANIGEPLLRKKLKAHFSEGNWNYIRKLGLIRDSIYGVDIQPIAIQIAKLRFFISLLVDEKIERDRKNQGIEPLPNLETKFVAADTLNRKELGDETEEGEASMGLKVERANELEEDLKEVRSNYFNASAREEKDRLKEKDEEIRTELVNELKNKKFHKGQIDLDKIANWNPYNVNDSANFFYPEWMFAEDDFDIAIANPPYIQLQKNGGKLADRYEDQDYETFRRTGDIYCLFYERGLELVNDEDGLLCYISSNKWMRAKYGKNLRKFLSAKDPLKLINFGGHKVFEGPTVDVNILLASNSSNNDLKATKIGNDFVEGDNLGEYFSKESISLSGLSKDTWFIGTKKEMELKKKIEDIGTPLKNWDVLIHYGIKTGYDKAFIIGEKRKDKLIEEDPKNKKIIKPILQGKDIMSYGYDFGGKYLIATHNGYTNSNGENISRVDIDDYPAIKTYLDEFWARLEGRYDQGDTPYNLRNCAYYEEFEKENIVWSGVGGQGFEMALAEPGIYLKEPANFMTAKRNFFLLGILHSKIANYYYDRIKTKIGKSGTRFYVKDFKRIPIPKVSYDDNSLVEKIEALVVKIIKMKKEDCDVDTTSLQDELDQMVYQLYDLKPEEIKIIEDSYEG